MEEDQISHQEWLTKRDEMRTDVPQQSRKSFSKTLQMGGSQGTSSSVLAARKGIFDVFH